MKARINKVLLTLLLVLGLLVAGVPILAQGSAPPVLDASETAVDASGAVMDDVASIEFADQTAELGTASSSTAIKKLAVPYIHQVWDTPDEFVGSWACAPTCAVMILAYYGRVPPNPITVSVPSPHTSNYGAYVSRQYSYKSYTFSHEHTEATGCGTATGRGAWGYIWKDSTPSCVSCGVITNLQAYLRLHDMTVSYAHYDESSARTLVQQEIDNGRPLIGRTYLTSGGHYVVIVGYEIDAQSSFWYLVNDPFGDKPYGSACGGDYGVPQPIRYSYSQMGLGDSTRGLIKIQPVSVAQPDLIVEDIWVDPDPPTAGDSNRIRFTIRNQGTGDAVGTFRSKLYFDGTYRVYADTSGLTAESTKTYYWDMTWPSDSNSHTIKVVVDADNAISESIEGNNERSESFSAIVECPYSCWDRSALSGDELAALARNHFPLGGVPQSGESMRVVAYAVAKAESGGNPSACGDVDIPYPGHLSIGLWQINTYWHPGYDRCLLFEEDYNADAAVEISSYGTDWDPWTAWNNGSYTQYLIEARKHFYPKVTSLSVSQTSINLGDAVTIYYSVSDDVGLSRVELWRTTDKSGVPDGSNWAGIKEASVSGTAYSGYFTDTPTPSGIYWYGIHVVDNSGAPEAWNCEKNSRTGNWPGVYGPDRVEVTQSPQIDLTPSSYSFGEIQPGQCSGTYPFTLQNIGGGTATGTVSLTGANANQFEITSGSGSFSLSAGATKTISVRFCPTSAGAKTATLLADGSNCNDDSSSLSGNGVLEPQIELTPWTYDFGDVRVGECSGTYAFTLQNIGGGTATGTVSLIGPDADEFEITSGSGSFSLGTGATKAISVRFCPTSTGVKGDAYIQVYGSNCNNDASVLYGTGVDEPQIEVTPSSHSFGDIQVGQCSGTQSFTLQNTGGGTATGTVSLTGANANQFEITSGSGSFSLSAGATKTISVRFCPTSTGTKSASLFADGSNCNDDSSSLSGNGVEEPGEVNISLQPATETVGVGGIFELVIRADAADQPVSGIDAFVDFDPAYLEVLSVTPGATLPTVLENSYDNTAGAVDYSAGKLGEPFPTGNFTVATIQFKALAPTNPSTLITFSTSLPRKTAADFSGSDITGTITGGTVFISEATVDISVVLQGGSRPDEGWEVPITIKFFSPGADVMTGTPVAQFDLTATKSGSTATCQCTVAPGTSDITAVSEHTLMNVKRNVVISTPSTAVDMGTLLEGNANDDSIINISDFGILAIAFMKTEAEPGYDARADFDRNGIINISDFGLLAVNYMKMSPMENQSPDQPTNITPIDGAETSLTPILSCSVFSDPDLADSHAASQWQVRELSGDYTSPVFDSGRDTDNLESIAIPSWTLKYSTTYYWRVRHQDSHGDWSSWSEETLFTTQGQFSMSGIILNVDVENSLVIVKPSNEETQVKVNLCKDTKLIGLFFPFDPANPPHIATFTPVQVPITINDLRFNDPVFIKANVDIAGKVEIAGADVAFLHRLPGNGWDLPEAASGFQYPLVNDHYGHQFLEDVDGVPYPGVDYNGLGEGDADLDTPIYSVANGAVLKIDEEGWGSIVIAHVYQGEWVYSQYGHLGPDRILVVRQGQFVTKGQLIGRVGNWETDTAHLHWEIRKGTHPDYMDASYWPYYVIEIEPWAQREEEIGNIYYDPEEWVDASGAYEPLGRYDVTPPGAVTDLSVSGVTESSISLSWTAPGDDADLGTASEYDIRYLISPITDENWDEADQYTGEPAPHPTGRNQIVVVTDLTAGTTYYFALKTRDEMGNYSLLSNLVSATTAGLTLTATG